jgi:hypothetical protein
VTILSGRAQAMREAGGGAAAAPWLRGDENGLRLVARAKEEPGADAGIDSFGRIRAALEGALRAASGHLDATAPLAAGGGPHSELGSRPASTTAPPGWGPPGAAWPAEPAAAAGLGAGLDPWHSAAAAAAAAALAPASSWRIPTAPAGEDAYGGAGAGAGAAPHGPLQQRASWQQLHSGGSGGPGWQTLVRAGPGSGRARAAAAPCLPQAPNPAAALDP